MRPLLAENSLRDAREATPELGLDATMRAVSPALAGAELSGNDPVVGGVVGGGDGALIFSDPFVGAAEKAGAHNNAAVSKSNSFFI